MAVLSEVVRYILAFLSRLPVSMLAHTMTNPAFSIVEVLFDTNPTVISGKDNEK